MPSSPRQLAPSPLSEKGEFGLIEHLARRVGAPANALHIPLGIGDDAAILPPLDCPVVTCDALIEGVHFRLDWTSARDLGWKAMAVNLSDIAAMGARPVAAFLTLALPASTPLNWVEEFYDGLAEAVSDFGCPLAGGDTTRAPTVALSLTLIGNSPLARAPITRAGARVGDVCLVTGTLGDSAAGLHLLLHPEAPGTEEIPAAARNWVLSRHFRPTPRLREMEAVLSTTPQGAVTAALDLSDGLWGDAAHIARCSGVALEVEAARVPLAPLTQEVSHALSCDPLAWALSGGEDYELLLCVRPEHAQAVREAIEATGTRATLVGRAVEASRGRAPVRVVGPRGEEIPAQSAWQHF
jgi:thiamine-monophosphate kinase